MGKVISLRGHAAGRDVNTTAGPTNHIGAINGGTNLVGNNGPITLLFEADKKRNVRFVVQPDPAIHITQEQIIALREMRNDWIALHTKLRKAPLTYAGAQTAINKSAGAASQALIRKDRYEDAVSYIKRQMAILANMKSAPSKDDE